MRVFVTGGAGFIGRHLVTELLKNGHTVTIFDNFSNSDRSSAIHIEKEGAKIIEGDIISLQEIVNAVKDHDVVVHLAAKISVDESIKNPSETFHVNVDGTKNVLIACEKNHVKKIIAASSAAVYGESLPDTNLDENSKINPISPYGESKVMMEHEIKEFAARQNITYIILRFFNIYGIGQSPEYAGVITKFIERISNDESLVIFGDGMQTRDFVSVRDVVSSICNAIQSSKNGIYNIGSGKPIMIKNLAEQMISLSKKNLKIQYADTKKGDIKHSQADISLAKKELKYIPRFDLDEIRDLLK